MTPILQFPNAALTTVCKSVDDIEVGRRVAFELLDILEEYQGQAIGLAANQIGHLWRVFVMDMAAFELDGSRIFINPEIVRRSQRLETAEEGCLSWEYGNQRTAVRRPAAVTVKAFDGGGNPFEVELAGMAARCALHEFDHLDGYSIFDIANGITPEERLLRAIFGEK